MENIIKIKNVSKIYKLYEKPIDRLKEALNPFKKKYHRDFYALKEIGFDIRRGDTIGIIGKNGSGKSTLLKIITGVLTQTSGTVNVNGRVSALLELGAGFNPEYTGIENIYLNGTMLGYTREEIQCKIDNILQFAEIGDFVYQPIKTYSSGMFVRLAFAVAVNVDPDILIVDEALAVGDIRFQMKCMEKFNEFREKGKTILFVSHEINSIKKFCNRVIWLNDGEIKAAGDTNYITDQYLDYLKISEKDEENTAFDMDIDIAKENNLKLELGQITKLTIFDEFYEEINIVEHNKKVLVKVEFEIHDESIKDIAIGIAIKRIDHLYICGLNTVLDEEKLTCKKGRNVCYLEYENLNLIGGNYYLDVALFEQNAYIPIDYRVKAKEFFVKTSYTGEGIVILKHKWISKGS